MDVGGGGVIHISMWLVGGGGATLILAYQQEAGVFMPK